MKAADTITTTQALLQEIEAFAKRHDILPSTVTKQGAGNRRLYARMVGGGSCTLVIAARLRAYMRERDGIAAEPPRPAGNVDHASEAVAAPGGGA
jgi:hypothetical protein